MKNPSLKPTPFLLACFASLCFSSVISFAQENPLNMERLSTANGLSSNFVYTILQDSKGYLWVGTNDGLNKYDGYTFKVFKNIPNDKSSLVENTITNLFEDRDGNIWIATQGGLCRYNYATNDFTTIDLFLKDTSEATYSVIEASKEELMILSPHATVLLNRYSRQVVKIRDPTPSLVKNNLSKDKNGNIYLATQNYTSECCSVFIYDRIQKIFNPFIDSLSLQKNKSTNVIFFDSRNSMWLGASGNVLMFRNPSVHRLKDSLQIQSAYQNQALVNAFYEDKEGNIWIGTAKGILLYNYTSGKFSQYEYGSTPSIIQDRLGMIWFCTYNGLYKLNPSQKKFKSLSTRSSSDPQLLNNFVFGFRPAGGNKTWVNYYWGVSKFSLLDLSNGEINHYAAENLTASDFFKMVTKNPKQIDDDTLKKHLPLLERHARDFVSWEGLIFDSKKRIWLLYHGAIDALGDPSIHLGFGGDFFSAQIWGNEIWLATSNAGLYCIETPTHSISKHFTTIPGKPSLCSNNLTCLLIEQNGNIWIGSKGNGLDYYDRQNETFKNYTIKNGLCNNSVFNLVKDNRGRLWIGTGGGLSCFDTITKKFKNFSQSDGLINVEYNRESAIKLNNGYILMGGLDGIDYFHPDSLFITPIKPTVQITDFKVFNRSVFPFAGIRMAHDKNYITIDFAVMDFRDPLANKYEYKLEGIDKDWVDAGNKHSISYATLPSGSYHFLVRGAGSDGVWSEEAKIDFIIFTPWWKTIWFYCGCAFFVMATILFLFHKSRIRQLKKLIQVRTKISQDLHDDVGATLSGIRVFSQLAKERPGNNSEYIDKITAYSDDMLNKLSDIVWSINAENDSFTHMISRLRNYAQTMTTAKNIHLEFHIDPVVEKKNLDTTLRKNIYMITREAINNAVKYAECSSLRISLKPAASGAELIITDNGKGFDTNKMKAGNGLINMQKRAEEMQNTLQVETEPGAGVSIRLFFNFT